MSDLERKILDAIAERKIVPTPAYVFLARRSVYWALALAFTVLGGISVAILLFVVSDYFATGWRVLDNIQFNELFVSIPVIWLALLVVFVAAATAALRYTKRGYRVSPPKTAALVLAASVAAGLALHVLRVGEQVHNTLSDLSPTYRAQTYVPFDEWSRPAEGFLGGTVVAHSGEMLTLMDFKNKSWTIDISAAVSTLDNPPLEEGDVAIEGVQTGPDTFRATMISEFH